MSAVDAERAVRDRVRGVILDMANVRPPAIDGDSDLIVDLGYDSLGLIELAGAIEAEFGLDPVPDEDVADIETVGDVEALVVGMLDAAGAR